MPSPAELDPVFEVFDRGIDWPAIAGEIGERVRLGGLAAFPYWPHVFETLVFTDSIWREELAELGGANELFRRLPRLSVHVALRENVIHTAYHLHRFFLSTGFALEGAFGITEIGGGYGAMCEILRHLGFSGPYTLIDLPGMLALQRAYLGLRRRPRGVAFEESFVAGDGALIALWSLSEADDELRERVVEGCSAFKSFLFAFQDDFHGRDNHGYFE